jgi:DNA-binding CsgD family transcriptional regulator
MRVQSLPADPSPVEGEHWEPSVSAFAVAYRLSAREREVLMLLLVGMHPKAIAARIGCGHASVRTHFGRMCRKVSCSGTRELLLRFFTEQGNLANAKRL